MQEFRADLHIHSRFSRATSTKLDIPLLAAWARVKGLAVLGTGDFTHPKWRAELAENLRYDENSGLYALRRPDSLNAALPALNLPGLHALPGAAVQEDAAGVALPAPLFMLQGEISSIYKRGGKVRKVHNLVFMPTLEAAERFSLRLEQVGNLHSDGRPILGLDSRDLLEMVLEAHPQAFLVPAHIWTPWFSVFGSKSGFNRMDDCFGDLTPEIFALETGLSSDPAMNRLWSHLDGYRLISNSDAHSGENLGREANIFAGEVSYAGMLRALKEPQRPDNATRFLGTLEFFPEEGKYHMDGHRKCNVLFTPEETRAHGGLCPVCGGPLTVGVLSRVKELADRAEPQYGGETNFASMVPLPEVLGEILGVGSKSRKVGDLYAKAIVRFGSELAILQQVPDNELARFFPPLGEAVARMRRGEVQLSGGFDGEYGVVRMFSEKEQKDLLRGAGISKQADGTGRVQGLTLLGEAVHPVARKGKKKSPLHTPAAAQTPGGTAHAPHVADLAPAHAAQEGESSAAPPRANGPAPLRDAPQSGAAFPDAGTEESSEDFLFSDDSDTPPFCPAPPAPGSASAVDAPCAAACAPRSKDAAHGHSGAVPAAAWQPAVPPQAPASASPQDDTPHNPCHGLNPSQERAVFAGPGPVLVLAGPGTGKTRTLVARATHLLDEGIGARHIVAVTFTRRAATEMDERLRAALGPDSPLPRTDTLHALALELWHRTHSDVPVLLSEESARRVFAEANGEETAQAIRDGWQTINLARERLEQPAQEFQEMAKRYFLQKQAWNLADYTDLLEFWLEQINAGLYTNPHGHVLVDEVQDLSPLQLSLVRSLLSSSGEGFFGIGDPDQSIYSFRGSHGQCRAFFASAWPGLEVISLTHNYRSRPGLLAAARFVLGEHAASPPLTATRTKPAGLFLFDAPSADSEASWVAERIASLIGLGSHTLSDALSARPPRTPGAAPGAKAGAARQPEEEPTAGTDYTVADASYSPGDIAVLVRTHALARAFRHALAHTNVPVAEPAADAFWSDPRVALIIRAAGRMLGIADGQGDPDNAETPACPDKVLTKGPLGVAAYLSTIPPFDTVFWQSGPFRALVKAYDLHGGWAQLITWVNLQSELELVRSRAEKVQILSLHAAKGLEFGVVFLPCLEDGLLPFVGPEFLTGKPEKGRITDMDEERRLFYVGLTRARDALFLSHSGKRMLYGRELRLKPSRFLDSLPKDVLTRSTLVARSSHKEKQLSLL